MINHRNLPAGAHSNNPAQVAYQAILDGFDDLEKQISLEISADLEVNEHLIKLYDKLNNHQDSIKKLDISISAFKQAHPDFKIPEEKIFTAAQKLDHQLSAAKSNFEVHKISYRSLFSDLIFKEIDELSLIQFSLEALRGMARVNPEDKVKEKYIELQNKNIEKFNAHYVPFENTLSKISSAVRAIKEHQDQIKGIKTRFQETLDQLQKYLGTNPPSNGPDDSRETLTAVNPPTQVMEEKKQDDSGHMREERRQKWLLEGTFVRKAEDDFEKIMKAYRNVLSRVQSTHKSERLIFFVNPANLTNLLKKFSNDVLNYKKAYGDLGQKLEFIKSFEQQTSIHQIQNALRNIENDIPAMQEDINEIAERKNESLYANTQVSFQAAQNPAETEQEYEEAYNQELNRAGNYSYNYQ